MGRQVLAAGLALAMSASLLGAALNAGEIPAPTSASPTQTSQINSEPEVEAGEAPASASTSTSPASTSRSTSAQVPIRSAALGSQTERVSDSAPTRIRIAALGIDASVVPVGVDEKQQFDVPSAEEVGWYRFGSDPSEAGSTVLAAHVDYAGRPGAFFDLANVSPGDELEVELIDQTTRTYRVVDNVLYDKIELPAEQLFRRSGAPILQLITCGGTFDFETRSYRGNVVVTAVPIGA